LIKFSEFKGIRRGDLFKLTWDDVDFGHQLLTLRDPKGTKTQTMPVSSEALEILKDMNGTSTCVFPGLGEKIRISIMNNWNAIKKHAGIPKEFRFHGLQHSYVSWLISNGVDLAVVQELSCRQFPRWQIAGR
jgi:integrase